LKSIFNKETFKIKMASSYRAPKYLEEVEITQDKGVVKKIIRHGQLDGGAGGQEDLVPLPG